MKLELVAAAALLAAAGAQADPASSFMGTVNILGTDYVVSMLYDDKGHFDQQSFDILGPTITFASEADATAAAKALIDAFGAGTDWNPGLPSDFNGTRIVYSFDDSTYRYMTITDYDEAPAYHGPFSQERHFASYYSFAQFAPAAVPEPRTWALMLIGLAGLGGLAGPGMLHRRRA